jgi:hypothetical protein
MVTHAAMCRSQQNGCGFILLPPLDRDPNNSFLESPRLFFLLGGSFASPAVTITRRHGQWSEGVLL